MKKYFFALAFLIIAGSVAVWSYVLRDHKSSVTISGISVGGVDCVAVEFSTNKRSACRNSGEDVLSFKQVVFPAGDITLILEKDGVPHELGLTYANEHNSKYCDVDISDIDNVQVQCRMANFLERLLS